MTLPDSSMADDATPRPRSPISSRRSGTSRRSSSRSTSPQEGSRDWLEYNTRRILSAPLTEGVDRHKVNQAMHLWASRRSTQSALTVEKILKCVETAEAEAVKNGYSKPLRVNSMMYNMAINAWAKSGDRTAPQRAEDLLQSMYERSISGRQPDVTPNTISFNSVIYAWASVRDRAGAQRAEAILERMEQLHAKENENQGNGGDVRPNRRSYSAVINAWAQAKDGTRNNAGDDQVSPAERAEQILRHMISLHKDAGRSDLSPDVFCFTNTMNAWARSTAPYKALRVEKLLHMMENTCRAGDISAKPNNYTYTAAISACAFTSPGQHSSDALRVASDLLDRIIRKDVFDCQPDSVMYAMLLKCFYQLAPNNTDIATKYNIREVLKKCCADGHFGEDIIRVIRNAFPGDENGCWKQVDIDPPRIPRALSIEDVPYEWCCNTKTKNGRKRRSDRHERRNDQDQPHPPGNWDKALGCGRPSAPSPVFTPPNIDRRHSGNPSKFDPPAHYVTPPQTKNLPASLVSDQLPTQIHIKNISPRTTVSTIVHMFEKVVGRNGCVVRARMELDSNVEVTSICAVIDFERPSDVEKVMHVNSLEDFVINGHYGIVKPVGTQRTTSRESREYRQGDASVSSRKEGGSRLYERGSGDDRGVRRVVQDEFSPMHGGKPRARR